MSIADYQKKNATIISIIREKKPTVNSMLNRTGMNKRQAEKEYERSMSIINQVNEEGAISVTFEELVDNSEGVLRFLCDKLGLEYEQKMMEGPKYNFVYPHDEVIKEKGIIKKNK